MKKQKISAKNSCFKWVKRILLVGLLGIVSAGLIHVPSWIKHAQSIIYAGDFLQVYNQVAVQVRDFIAEKTTYRMLDANFWTLESVQEREALPLYKVIPATPAQAFASVVSNAPAATEMPGWSRSHGDNSSDKYSAAKLITRKNVQALNVAWTYKTSGAVANIQATPVYAGEALVFPNALSQIVAVHPQSGETLWTFDPKLPRPAQRGLLYWPGSAQASPRIFFAARGRLFALDARTGLPVPEFQGGSVAVGYEVRVAPAVSGDKLLLTSFKPALHAYDVHSGKRVWTADLVSAYEPSENQRPADGHRPLYDGANPWGGFSVDDARGLAFLTTSNPTPVGVGMHRRGQNSHANSVIAINLTTGKIAWSFQEIAHDLWDLDIPAPPVLATINQNGQRIDVVVAVTKSGNSLVLDRLTGKSVFDQRLRRAPVSQVPGERTASYQPDPVLPEPFGRQEFTISDVTDIGEENRKSVLKQIGDATLGFYSPHRPDHQTVFFGLHGGAMQMGPSLDRTTGILYIASTHEPSMFTITAAARHSAGKKANQGTGHDAFMTHCAVCHGSSTKGGGQAPALDGALQRYDRQGLRNLVKHGFQSMPAIAEISDVELDSLFGYLFDGENVTYTKAKEGLPELSGPTAYVRTQYKKLRDHEGFPGSRPPWGTLNALDLNTGRIVWRVPLGRYQQLIERGLPQTGTENFGGPIVTAGGLVFVSGTKDSLIRAFDASTGVELWEHKLPFVGSASPMTYVYKGRQFVVIPATGGGTLALYDSTVKTGSAFVAFSLNENIALGR